MNVKVYPEHLLGRSHLPRRLVWEFFGDQRPLTRLDVDMRKARMFAAARKEQR